MARGRFDFRPVFATREKKHSLTKRLNFARRGNGRVSHFAHRLGKRTPGGSNYPPSPFSRINFFPIDEAARQYRLERAPPLRHILEDSRLIWQPRFAKIPRGVTGPAVDWLLNKAITMRSHGIARYSPAAFINEWSSDIGPRDPTREIGDGKIIYRPLTRGMRSVGALANEFVGIKRQVIELHGALWTHRKNNSGMDSFCGRQYLSRQNSFQRNLITGKNSYWK